MCDREEENHIGRGQGTDRMEGGREGEEESVCWTFRMLDARNVQEVNSPAGGGGFGGG